MSSEDNKVDTREVSRSVSEWQKTPLVGLEEVLSAKLVKWDQERLTQVSRC